MTPAHALAIVGAGAVAGGVNTIVGSGSLVTFPTLLGLGYPAVLANVTNTIGLVPGSVSGAVGYRTELRGQRGRLLRLGGAALAGGVTGSLLLLAAPGAFDLVVPFLILLACLLMAVQPQIARRQPTGPTGLLGHPVVLPAAVYLTGIYGGYFGAAQGVLLLAFMSLALREDLQRLNATKNVLTALVNGVAGIVFVLISHVAWGAAALLAGGAVVGAPAVGVLMLVVLFYFLNSGRQILQGGLHLIPPRYRTHVALLGARVEPMLRGYVRGVIAVTLYTVGTAWLVLGLWFHASLAPLISLAVGVLELIPVVGPAASIALFGALAVVDGHGPWTFAGFMGLAVFLRVSVDNIVGPLVLGRAVTLHPVAVIIAFLTGASLFGVLGVFVAVPVAAAAKIVLAVWYGEDEG